MINKAKILYLTNIPSPYMVDYLNELGKNCDLTVLFDQSFYVHREDSWKNYKIETFKGVVLNKKSGKVGKFSPSVIKYLKKNRYDYIFVTNMSFPNGILAIFYMKLLGIPFVLESEGGFPKDGKGLKEKAKKILMRNASLYFSANEIGDDYFLQYGATKDKIVRYPFTSIYEKEILQNVLTYEEKNAIKKELNIKEEKIVITVGRMIKGKGFDVLLNASNLLSRDVGIYIVGGKPTEEYLLLAEKHKLSNVHFVDFMSSDRLYKYLRASNVFAFPTRTDVWGLVLNEAMANGLPAVCSKGAIAALTMVENGINGYLYEIEDPDELAEKLNLLLNDDELCNRMAKNNLIKIKDYTFEAMAKMHIDFFNRNK